MDILTKPFFNWIYKSLKKLLLFLGSILLLMLILSFTSLPFWADYYLGVSTDPLEKNPEVIVVLGGSGMPSQNGLIRCYYGAEAAIKYPDAQVIIALPGDTLDYNSSIKRMAKELMIRGVDSCRIIYENEGTNTRWEALNVKQRFYPKSSPSLLIVTSPSHMYRSVKTFEKAGFNQVGGLASFGRANEEALDFNAEELGGRQSLPDVGNQLSLRYKVWTRMHTQISVMREYTAITYYWMMGWI
ncbi:MAG: hypothetical protein GQ527_08050 [Bacteroidales bacterium]|nr:hypothetical protein [Bacteroidales bacterium]